jgi:hypothetical protein
MATLLAAFPDVDLTMKKSELPSKECPVCGRGFEWRKKWARDWLQVIYCSDACRKRTPRGKASPIKLS